MNRMYCTKNLKNLLFDIKLIAISTKKSPFPYSESRGNIIRSVIVTQKADPTALFGFVLATPSGGGGGSGLAWGEVLIDRHTHI